MGSGIIVSSKAVHQYEIMNLRLRSKRKTESTREQYLTMLALEMVTNYIYTVGLEKVVLLVPPSKIKVLILHLLKQ